MDMRVLAGPVLCALVCGAVVVGCGDSVLSPSPPAVPALGPSLSLALGDYTMTVLADPACTQIPEALRTRQYAARVTRQPDPSQARLSVSVSAPSLRSFGFGLGLAGNDVGFTIDGPHFFELLPDFTQLEIGGEAPTDVHATAADGTLSIPFKGSFQYCALKSEQSHINNCYMTPADQKISDANCWSSNHRMVFSGPRHP
jgi:hypothetical protein